MFRNCLADLNDKSLPLFLRLLTQKNIGNCLTEVPDNNNDLMKIYD